MNSRLILIVGGAGYIGSHVAKLLSRQGYSIVTFDNLATGHKSSVRWGDFVQGELTSGDIFATVNKYRPQTVIHLAGSCYVGESNKDPAKYYKNNVVGTINLLDAMRQYEVNHLIFSSSCTVYGIPPHLPIREDSPLAPISPYGRTKLMIEQIIKDYTMAYGLSATIFRYFNASGADQGNEIGELHEPETHLIPLVMRAATDPDSPLLINGHSFATPDGTCIRDYLHVEDIASAHLAALKLPSALGVHVYNLGTGQGHSVLEIIKLATQIVGQAIAYEFGDPRVGDPPELVADPSLAIEKLSWQPTHSDLDNIIRTAWRWHNQQK